jgi:hypothetical protein
MPAKKSVTSANLELLGATRLANLLIEISQDDLKLRRRLRYELAGEAGVEAVAAEISKSLLALGKSKTFVDSEKRRPFVKHIDLLRQMILDRVAVERPDLALDLLWQFMALAGRTFERVDDSNGDVGDVFREACSGLGAVAAAGSADPIRLADRVFGAVTCNEYGEYDCLIPAVFPALARTGAFHLKQQLRKALRHPVLKDPNGYHAAALKRALQEIADAEGDVDAFIEQTSKEDRERPDVAAAIGRRLLVEGRMIEALDVLKSAAPKQRTPSADDLDEDLADDHGEYGSSEWNEAWVEALIANDRLQEAQEFRWIRFERYLDASSLRAFLGALPESDRAASEQKALRYALAYSHFATALHFLTDWPDPSAAAHLLLDRRVELDGNLYFVLDPAAKALEGKHPQAATLIYRAMIEHTLDRVKSTRYGHAARHLFECKSLMAKIENNNDLEPHGAFLARIKSTHARKTGFWSRVAVLGPLSV